jgi:DNA-binding response OmpR family regulator
MARILHQWDIMPIFIVDDDKDVRESIGAVLESSGYPVIEAGCGADALSHLREQGGEVALMLLDITMPGMNGLELLAVLEEEGIRPQTLVITASEPIRLAGLSERGIWILRKPIDPRLLLESIAVVLGKEHAHGSPVTC